MEFEKNVFEYITKLYISKYVKNFGIDKNLEYEIFECEQNMQIVCEVCNRSVLSSKFTKHVVHCLETNNRNI